MQSISEIINLLEKFALSEKYGLMAFVTILYNSSFVFWRVTNLRQIWILLRRFFSLDLIMMAFLNVFVEKGLLLPLKIYF